MTGPFGRVYVLYHPITGEVRYVGQTIQPLRKRLHGHKYDATKKLSNSHTSRWINSLLQQGLEPALCVWARAATREELDTLEIYWIAEFLKHGFRLTNHSPGGASDRPRRPQGVSKATREKLSRANKGQIRSPAARERISRGQRGHTVSPETRKKLRDANTGKSHSLESRRKMSVSRTGVTHSAESVEKRVLSGRGKTGSPVLSEQQVWEIKELLWVGRLTYEVIASMYRVSTGTVSDIRSGKTWTYVAFSGGEDRGVRRSRERISGNPDLVPYYVGEIKALLHAGEISQKDIAERFSVTQTTVSRINLGKAWAEVEAAVN